jgi:hypothetical protein
MCATKCVSAAMGDLLEQMALEVPGTCQSALLKICRNHIECQNYQLEKIGSLCCSFPRLLSEAMASLSIR